MPSLSNTFEWVKKARSIHGERYDYALSNYVKWNVKLTIVCQIHGQFSQTPNGHLNGKGCPACGLELAKKSRIGNTDKWTKRAREIHGDKYDYSLSQFKGDRNKLKIICKIYGVFTQAAGSHLQGCGCPGCGNYGFDKSAQGHLYFLISEDCKFLKIGVTKSPSRRFKELEKSIPFKFSIVRIEAASGKIVAERESQMKNKFSNAGLKGFDGATEWLIIDEKLITEVIWLNLTNKTND